VLTIINTEITAGLFSSGVTTSGPTFIYDSDINGHAGGGVYATSSLTMDNTDVSSNGEFGVTVVGLLTSPITATIRNSTIEDNTDPSFSGDSGEGIAAVANVHLTVDNTTVQRNAKVGISGQTQLSYYPVLTVTNSIVQNNYDGGIESAGNLTILDTRVSGNTRSFFGMGGVKVSNAELRIERSEITNNGGGGCGAGVLVDGTNARIRDTIIAYNQSDNGAGICVYNQGDAKIRRSVIYSNTTTGDGGGIYVGYLGFSGTLALANSTLTNNNADGNGGGIYALVGEIDLTNVTIARNYADADDASGGTGGGYMVDVFSPVHFDMVNSLVAVNVLGDGSKSDCNGAITSGGTNLIRVADGCTGFIGSDLTGTDASPLNALLGEFQNKGFYTWIIPFGVNSPAADAGNHSVCTSQPVNSIDQRTYSRIDADGNGDGGSDGNNCDIGAFERNAEAPYQVFVHLLMK